MDRIIQLVAEHTKLSIEEVVSHGRKHAAKRNIAYWLCQRIAGIGPTRIAPTFNLLSASTVSAGEALHREKMSQNRTLLRFSKKLADKVMEFCPELPMKDPYKPRERINDSRGNYEQEIGLNECHNLWCSVLLQAIIDATNSHLSGGRKNNRVELDRIYARSWLLRGGPWFKAVCEFAGMDHDYVHKNVCELLDA